MKTKIIYSILFLFSISICFAQEEQDEFTSIFKTKQNSLNTLSSFSETSTYQTIQSNNLIFVQQIGNKNQIDSSIKAINSDVNLLQNGNDNFILVDKSADQINQFVLQSGNNNDVYDFNMNTQNSINTNFTQNGNNLNLINIGANSISKELTVKQSGNSGTVIILNK